MHSAEAGRSGDGKPVLIEVARESIRYTAGGRGDLPIDPEEFSDELRAQRASFVTLYEAGALRGCIGNLLPTDPLVVDVARNARKAAFHDPRFSPVRLDEVDVLEIHISVLSALEAIDCEGDRDVLAQLRPGIDGLVLLESFTGGTLLPSVWDRIREPREFLSAVKAKAGLPAGYWSDTIRFFRYTVENAS